MQISDLNRFHWIILGLLLGPLVAYVWTSNGTDIESIRSASSQEFERDLTLTDPKSGLPFISNIVIHPAEDSFDGKVNVVLYKHLAHDKQGRVSDSLEKRLIAKIPYKPAYPNRVDADPNMTIATYLTDVAKENSGVHYRFGWWLEPKYAVMVGAGAGALLIGGVWPTALALITGAGLGPKVDPNRKKGIDWGSLFRKAPKPQETVREKAGASVSIESTHAVADAYEAKLAAGAKPRVAGKVPETSTEAQPVQQLTGGPLEQQTQVVAEAEEVEVKGEYYPVIYKKK